MGEASQSAPRFSRGERDMPTKSYPSTKVIFNKSTSSKQHECEVIYVNV